MTVNVDVEVVGIKCEFSSVNSVSVGYDFPPDCQACCIEGLGRQVLHSISIPRWLAGLIISVVGLQFIREVYWDFEYEEVVTPNIYNFDLWKTSGHADHYKQNMFSFDIEKQEFGLKPMNCPGQLHLYLGFRVEPSELSWLATSDTLTLFGALAWCYFKP